MNLFSSGNPAANLEKISQIKAWVYQYLELATDVPISISQLRCTEPGCPPLETAIAVMTNPVQKYKIHKSVDQIEQVDISAHLPH